MYDLLICNGELPPHAVAERLAANAFSITCADGGANQARDYGINPGCIIGDLDSITPETLAYFAERNIDIVHLQRQDDTDFEKALKLLRHRGVDRLVILGLTGGLLDHTLGNLSILRRYIDAMEIVIYDPDYRIDIITEDTRLNSTPDSRVSVIPLQPSTGVRYKGLQYELEGSTLEDGMKEGTCNRALDTSFEITIESGALMVFRELTLDITGP